MKGVSREARKIIWNARKKINNLQYTRAGHLKEGITKRQNRQLHRISFQLNQLHLQTYNFYKKTALGELFKWLKEPEKEVGKAGKVKQTADEQNMACG